MGNDPTGESRIGVARRDLDSGGILLNKVEDGTDEEDEDVARDELEEDLGNRDERRRDWGRALAGRPDPHASHMMVRRRTQYSV